MLYLINGHPVTPRQARNFILSNAASRGYEADDVQAWWDRHADDEDARDQLADATDYQLELV